MNRFAKMKKERIYTLFETLSKKTQIFRLIPFLLNIVTIHINAKGDYFRNRLP